MGNNYKALTREGLLTPRQEKLFKSLLRSYQDTASYWPRDFNNIDLK